MSEEFGPRVAIVSSKELGTRCWLAARFIEGSRCDRVMACSYPEKKTCRAIAAEVTHLREEAANINASIQGKIARLIGKGGYDT